MKQLVHEEFLNLSDEDSILTLLPDSMKGENILLVLDDVSSVNSGQLTPLYALRAAGAKISVLMTTRMRHIAQTFSSSCTYPLRPLSDEESWRLFKQIAFSVPMEEVRHLEEIAKVIVKNCHGVPLDIQRMACLLQGKTDVEEWKRNAAFESWHLPNFQMFSVLSFAYHDLPKALKPCFAYCSIFPKDAIIDKNDLIRLWLAQGFLYHRGVKGSVETGEEFFDILLKNSLLQVYKQDEDGNVMECTMHDLIHDLAMYVSRHNLLIINEPVDRESFSSEVRHLVISGNIQEALEGSVKLRTLYSRVPVPHDLLSQARYLYVLKLNGINLKVVPKNLGRLKCVRYLDLSNNPIKYLPETIIHLYSLQTLMLLNCKDLLELPKGLDNMINLSHIEISPLQLSSKMLPPTALRILPPIKLDEEEGPVKFSELGKFVDITGLLCISGLEFLKDKEAAQEARIGSKHRLSALELCWNRERPEAGDSRHSRDENVLDGLQPHSKIGRLGLINYDSQKFSKWVIRMKGEDNERLHRLAKLELVNCKRCLQLPTLGQLPCLRELLISGMDNISSIGQEFYKYVDDIEEGVLQVCFPALTRLELRDLSRLREWLPAPASEKMNSFKAFPRLVTLQVLNCPNLSL